MNYIADFQARTDLVSRYGNNALILYALQLRFDILDIISIASDALTDGGNSKKCDCVTAYNSKNDLWSSDQLYSIVVFFPKI